MALKTQLHERDDTLMAIANQLAGCWLPDQNRPSDVQIEAIVTLLLMRLTDRIRDEKREPPRTTAVSPRIKRVLDHIDRDLCATHSLKSLADIAGVSTYHFARMFLAATGRRLHQYVVERRLAHGKRRLKQSDDPIVKIALDCGFASQSHMTEVFTKILGTTPGKMRRNVP
ncbi:AraC family transcriptional regulator [uncultured Marivita sp.]|uniref:helix-turn-helix domain-containing protein n=1 Tax=uncultured Marivita sp. TaxID=888080 RepID=UPI0026162487|nr:AraC family transcriptional regulator [uncultured Marivita sp.]